MGLCPTMAPSTPFVQRPSFACRINQLPARENWPCPLGGWVQLDDAYWGGQRRGGRGAPGKTPFVAAVELNDEGRPMRMRLSRVGGFRSEEIAAWARCHLEPGTVVVSDALSCFSAVQQAGCIHQPFVTGSGPQSAQHPALTWVNTILGNVKRSFHGTYGTGHPALRITKPDRRWRE